MKIIALEEHYGLPVIYEAAKKANEGEVDRKVGLMSLDDAVKFKNEYSE